MRTTANSSPAAFSRTIIERRPCRSTGTYCRSTAPLLARARTGLPTTSLLLERPRAGEGLLNSLATTSPPTTADAHSRPPGPAARARQPLCHAITYRADVAPTISAVARPVISGDRWIAERLAYPRE